MTEHKIIYKDIKTLIPYVNNSRSHSDEQISQVAASIKEFGFTNPILLDGDNGIIAGHGRLLAAKKLNIDNIPVLNYHTLQKHKRKPKFKPITVWPWMPVGMLKY